ncbi:MAG TPA: Ig domain-containing protein [Steroidobacteraceae bacterium]
MRVSACAPPGRLVCAWFLTATAAMLSACAGGSRSPVTGPVGTTAGVTLSSSTNSAQLQQGTTLVLTATVTKDTNNAGVTWTLPGDPAVVGVLSNITTATVTYTAPTGITGTTTPIVTATSIADTTQYASATLVVLGTPIIDPPVLFPGNVSSLYSAGVTVSGGLAPFTWSVTSSSGPLPPGITLGTSTIASTAISGTPTTEGSYPFQIKVTDTNNNSATVDLTLLIKPAAACLLTGHYALLYTGYANDKPAVGAASLTISTAGTLTGYQDFTAADTPIAESVTGTCTTRTANNGTLTLTGTGASPIYDYAVTTSLASGRVQLINGGDTQSGTGLLLVQDATAFNLPALAGSYAFGSLGAATDGSRMGLAGTLSIDAGGMVMAGRADSNGSGALNAAPLTGNLGSPDANGRGTLVLTSGSTSFHFAYYIVTVNRLLIVSAESTATAPRLAGFLTRQSGTFDNSSLAGSGVLSLWGAGNSPVSPNAVLALGRLSNANAGGGTIDLALDTASLATGTLNKSFTGATYAVDADGHAALSYTDSGVTRSFVLYLDGPANGYVVEKGSSVGSAGLLEAQIAGPYVNTLPGLFVSGTQFGQDVAPMLLLPAVHVAAGALSAANATGFFALDAATGRGIGTFTASGSLPAVIALYVIGPNKIVSLRLGAINRSAVIDWLGS